MKRPLREYFKAWVVGSSFPVMFIPLLKFGIAHQMHPIDRLHPPPGVIYPLVIENVPVVMPFYFGLANVIYFVVRDHYLKRRGDINLRHWATGMIFGAGLSAYGFVIHSMPSTIFNLSGWHQYLVPPAVALLYGLIWRICVKGLNQLFGLEPYEATAGSPADTPVRSQALPVSEGSDTRESARL